MVTYVSYVGYVVIIWSDTSFTVGCSCINWWCRAFVVWF